MPRDASLPDNVCNYFQSGPSFAYTEKRVFVSCRIELFEHSQSVYIHIYIIYCVYIFIICCIYIYYILNNRYIVFTICLLFLDRIWYAIWLKNNSTIWNEFITKFQVISYKIDVFYIGLNKFLPFLPHLQTQLQDSSRLTFSWPFYYISFSSFTFPGTPYRIFLLYLPSLPCHFYLVVIEQRQHTFTFLCISTKVTVFLDKHEK